MTLAGDLAFRVTLAGGLASAVFTLLVTETAMFVVFGCSCCEAVVFFAVFVVTAN